MLGFPARAVPVPGARAFWRFFTARCPGFFLEIARAIEMVEMTGFITFLADLIQNICFYDLFTNYFSFFPTKNSTNLLLILI